MIILYHIRDVIVNFFVVFIMQTVFYEIRIDKTTGEPIIS